MRRGNLKGTKTMKPTEISAFCSAAGVPAAQPYVQTLGAISATNAGKLCLPTGCAAKLTAICFDEVMAKWTGLAARLAAGKSGTARIDGLYVDGREYYFVEFKKMRMSQLKKFAVKLHRKVYESILLLVEKGLKSVADCRTELTYIVVSPGIPRLTAHDIQVGFTQGLPPVQRIAMQQQLFSTLPNCIAKPWRHSAVRAHFGLSRLEEIVYKRALSLTPRLFNDYASEMGWV